MYKHVAWHQCHKTTLSAAYLAATSFMNAKTMSPRKKTKSPKYFQVLYQT